MIHPSALAECRIPDDCDIGPFAVVGRDVVLGPGVSVGAHAVIEGRTTLGEGVRVGPGAVIGTEPQDLKYAGESTELIIGDRTVVRELANINRGTAATGKTVIGPDCLIMAYVHIAHDCRVGSGVILANAVNVAGHVEIGDFAIIGGVVPVHQFVRIGAHSMIGGGFRVPMDIPPFCLVGGYPLRVASLNAVGLRRRGFSGERLENMEKAFQLLYREQGNFSSKARRILEEDGWSEDARYLASFILESKRGIVC
jgi:UDP-N-acetylglucosamine acyltransferase